MSKGVRFILASSLTLAFLAVSCVTTPRKPEGGLSDPHRPSYHFLPPADFACDAMGLIQWKGRYHLFYQYQPGSVVLSAGVWAHAVSDDLVHWEHLPVALVPTPGGPDSDGCCGGMTVDNDGVPTIVYTGSVPGWPYTSRTCISTGSDDLVTWTKHPANPVIRDLPEGLDITGFRDPWVWREGDTWYQLVGSGIHGVGGTLPLYKSPDLIHWEYLGLLLTGNSEQTDAMWECPEFFPLDGRHVLLVSGNPVAKVFYFVGSYADQTYDSKLRGRVDLGAHFYAAHTMLDDQGRRLLWGWLREGRKREAQRAAGWSGAISLPRVVSLDADGWLRSEPVPELKALRGRHFTLADVPLTDGEPHTPDGVAGDRLEIVAEFNAARSGHVGLAVRCSPDGEEQTRISYSFTKDRFYFDCQRSSLDSTTERLATGGPLRLSRGSPLRLHIFLDGSTIEVFANGRAAASRIYPTRSDSVGIQLIGARGDSRLTSLDIWEMRPIWDGTESIPDHP